MHVGHLLLDRAFERGLIRVIGKPDGSISLQVRVFGAWVGIVNMQEYEVKKHERL